MEKAILVGVQKRNELAWEVEDTLSELAQLSWTAGAEVVDQHLVRQMKIDPATYIGKGKAKEIGEARELNGCDVVVFDEDLSPAQARNLERIIGVKVLDRTQIILDIFAQHAHSREGKLQIELAQLEYLLPRLRHMWTHLERQQGGIGLRGPGEKQLELDRRRIQQQISKLRKELGQVRKRRDEQRKSRRKHGWSLMALVGYTNAGKSRLLKSLTGADATSYSKLFSTLDPMIRRVDLPNRQLALLADTVGFIRKLPHHLVEAFKATLEEVVEADLLIHVIDISHAHVEQQLEAVHVVLRELGVCQTPTLYVLNKIDLEGPRSRLKSWTQRLENAVSVSALTGEGLDDLRHTLADHLRATRTTIQVSIPLSEGKLLAMIRETCTLLEEEVGEVSVFYSASVPHHLVNRLKAYEVKNP